MDLGNPSGYPVPVSLEAPGEKDLKWGCGKGLAQ